MTTRLWFTTTLLAGAVGLGCTGVVGGGAGPETPADPVASDGTSPAPTGSGKPGTPSSPGGQSGITTGGAGGSTPAGTGGTGGTTPASMPTTPGTDPAAPIPEPKPAFVAPSFTCKASDTGAIPRRLWRLTPSQYRNTIGAFFAQPQMRFKGTETERRHDVPGGTQSPFSSGGTSDRFSTFDTPAVGDFEFRGAMDTAALLADTWVREQTDRGGTCYFKNAAPVTKGCVRQTVLERGPVLFGRPLTEAEADSYDKLARDNMGAFGEADAAALAFQTLFASPQFLYRTEVGTTAGATAAALSPFELATAMSFALTDWPPDEPLWAAAMSGQLATADQVRSQITRLLTTYGGLARNEPLLRFLREYFHYDRVLQVFKDPKDFRDHNPEALKRETDQFVQSVLAGNTRKDFLKTLLTSSAGYVTHSNNIKTALYTYGLLDFPKGDDGARPYALPPEQRAGILTQPSFLAGYSEPTHTQPVQRGRFIAESLLCQTVPELPIGQVPPLTDLGPNATMRERLAVHSKGTCWACHQLMDPLGLPFEMFDHLGRFRTAEAGKTLDVTGKLAADSGVDGVFASPLELARKLAASQLVEQCFVRHAFRNFFGRYEAEGDGCALVAAYDAYRKSGGDLVELLTALFVSKSSLTRTLK